MTKTAADRPWALGFLCLVWGVALPVFFLNPLAKTSHPGIWVWIVTLLLLFLGALILRTRTSRRWEIWTKRAYPILLILFLLPLAELCSYLLLFHGLPKSRLAEAFHTLDLATSPPRFAPYLWSNYAPNPQSPEVNAFGWRYGGGPRRASKRILVMGGSTVWSDGAKTPEASYPAQIEAALRAKGYDADVINAGAADHTSAEILGLFQFRGLAEKPDIVIFHVENDIAPLLSPRPYVSDYSHWRKATRTLSNENQLFRHLWRIPSWTARLSLFALLTPDGNDHASVGEELTTPQEMLLAETDPNQRYPEGLDRNLRSLAAIAKAHGVKPYFASVPFQLDNPGSMLLHLGLNEERISRARRRWQAAIDRDNEVIRRVGLDTGTAVLPFRDFYLSSPDHYLDHCHLDERGNAELGAFVADRLSESGVLGPVPPAG